MIPTTKTHESLADDTATGGQALVAPPQNDGTVNAHFVCGPQPYTSNEFH